MHTVEQNADVPIRDDTNNASTTIENDVAQMESTGDDIAYPGNCTLLKTVVSVFWLCTFVALWIALWTTHGLPLSDIGVPWVSLPGPTDVP